ncbi:MAG: MBOAT family O-acyltransferase [Pseudomonadota bacterium]
MLFNSQIFLLFFLPVTVAGFLLMMTSGRTRAGVAWLVLTSLFFYGWWNPIYLVLIAGSIGFNYFIGAKIAAAPTIAKRALLGFGVAGNLATLGYFKYAGFLAANLSALGGFAVDVGDIVLPLGISFFTFQQIAYLVDASRGETASHDFLHYCLFVCFFPQLIAGPIVHHQHVLPQFKRFENYRFDAGMFGDGLFLLLLGLFKKVVFADTAATYASPIFGAADAGLEVTFFEAWAGAIAYTLQIYFDFSGYSDMALGLGRMFGIRLPLNFNSPYKALSIIDFWRRWHMTLSAFLRDYLYIPLGGNRGGAVARYRNLLATMLLGGLWHGASWTFVAWGALHGSYLVVNHLWRTTTASQQLAGTLVFKVFAWVLTFLCVVVAWVLFRSLTFAGAADMLHAMIGGNGFVLPAQIAKVIPWLPGFVTTTGTMPLLAGGTVMGVVEMLGMFAIMAVALSMPNLYEQRGWQKLLAVLLTFYFTVQAVFFTRIPSEFLYFQF